MLHRITLHLARSRQFPDGSSRHGYEIVAPLDADGRLDPAEWRSRRRSCRVRRFWAGEPARQGRLIHRPGGAGGATWLIDYNDATDADDEAGYRLGTHRFVPGEYVSVRDEDGEMHTFRIASIEALDKADGMARA
jgi:hypothetical protein